MTNETIVAVYDTAGHADAAVESLEAAGVASTAISLYAGAPRSAAPQRTEAPAREPGFWASLFGGAPDHDTDVYDRSLESGATIVSVKVATSEVDRVLDILERHHPIDIDNRAEGYGLAPGATPGRPAAGPSANPALPSDGSVGRGNETIQLAEENLAVGKRVVNRGTTRVRRFVVETPVEQSVSLHEEAVRLERRPVAATGQVGEADFSDKTVEMSELGEEVVVGKTARVYEEVSLRKEASERVETVRDTVRKQDVVIEQVPDASRVVNNR